MRIGVSANCDRRCNVFDTDARDLDELEIADVMDDARALVELELSKKYC